MEMEMEQATTVTYTPAHASANTAGQYAKHLFFLLIAFLSALVFLKIEVPMLLGANAQWNERIRPFEGILHVHAFFGSAALAAGTIQFFMLSRQKYPRIHRLLGRFYVVAVAISAPLAIWVAAYYGKPSEATASMAQGAIWFYATAAALLTILKRNLVQHRIWMARSYALGLTFVMARFITEILQVRVIDSSGGAPGFIWIMTIGAVLFADLITRWNTLRPRKVVSGLA